jgi:hypothetical protein
MDSALTQNPRFVSSSDFHLQENSPAIGAGIWVGLYKDMDGYDYSTISPAIGCYEYLGEIPDEPPQPPDPPQPPEPPVSTGKIIVYNGKIVKHSGKIVKR